MEELMRQFLKASKLDFALNTQRVFAAWDAASGASAYTLRRFFRDGTLQVTLSSSMVRSQLEFQKEAIVTSMNELLCRDPLFDKECGAVGLVRNIVLR